MPRSSGLFVAALFLLVSLIISQRTECQIKSREPQPVFEDDRIRVEIPAGWSVQTATEHVSGDKPFELPIGALLTKGKYRLYLLSHQQQASGIEGGRFSEVVQYVSPWIDMSELPWLSCPTEMPGSEVVTHTKLTREDFYFNTAHANKKALADCGNPRIKGTLWYGSYFVETCVGKNTPFACGGFFLTYEDLSGSQPQPRTVNGVTASDESQMVYAITFDTKTPDTLPRKGDPSLRAVLKEAHGIVGSIVYK
jgi:hypothetical protein